jgi:hypothetical protein
LEESHAQAEYGGRAPLGRTGTTSAAAPELAFGNRAVDGHRGAEHGETGTFDEASTQVFEVMVEP